MVPLSSMGHISATAPFSEERLQFMGCSCSILTCAPQLQLYDTYPWKYSRLRDVMLYTLASSDTTDVADKADLLHKRAGYVLIDLLM